MIEKFQVCINPKCENDSFYLERQEADPYWRLKCTNPDCNTTLIFDKHKTIKVKIKEE